VPIYYYKDDWVVGLGMVEIKTEVSRKSSKNTSKNGSENSGFRVAR